MKKSDKSIFFYNSLLVKKNSGDPIRLFIAKY